MLALTVVGDEVITKDKRWATVNVPVGSVGRVVKKDYVTIAGQKLHRYTILIGGDEILMFRSGFDKIGG
jgi:hypothetical protein